MDMLYFDEAMKRWIHKTARQNYWRVADWYDLDDLIQDGYLTYCKCRHNYRPAKKGGSKNNQRLFMAYFRTAYCNHIVGLANKRTANMDEVCVSALLTDSEDERVYLNASIENEAPARIAFARAGARYRWAAEKIATDTSKYHKSRYYNRVIPGAAGPKRTLIRSRLRKRETHEEHYDRITGISNISKKLRDLIDSD